MDLNAFFQGLLRSIDITTSFNLMLVGSIFLLTILGEAYIEVPLLIESLWLVIGYQMVSNSLSLITSLCSLLAAQTGRQIGIFTIYLLLSGINRPLTRFIPGFFYKSRLYQKYREKESLLDSRYLSVAPVIIGMLTPLNGPMKLLLILRRRPGTLLVGTLFSGLIFDCVYLAMGAVFHKTSLNLAYLPVFLLFGFLVFLAIRTRVMK